MKVAKIEPKMAAGPHLSSKKTVEFVHVENQYSFKEDLLCKYKLIDLRPKDGDRVALFQLGWNSVKDYVLFEWAPTKEGETSVKFSRNHLPRSSADLYQLCYISAENELQGASAPFQFTADDNSSTLSLNNLNIEAPKIKNRKLREQDKDRQIHKLKEENAILKECIKSLIDQRKEQSDNKYDDISNLREITEKLYTALKFQQTEMEILKSKLNQQENSFGNQINEIGYYGN